MYYDIVVSPFGADACRMVEVALCAEDSGYDGVSVLDHYTGSMLGSGRGHDLFTTLGAMAGATNRVRIGPLVANMMNYHPVRLVVAMASLQSLSGGRAVLGLGTGAARGSRFGGEQQAIGAPIYDLPTRKRRLAETITAFRYAWNHDGVYDAPFNGEFFTIDGERLGKTVGSEQVPPIVVGMSAPHLVEVALAHGDGANVNFGPQSSQVLGCFSNRPPSFELSLHLLFNPGGSETILGNLAEHDYLIDRVTMLVTAPFDLAEIARFGAAVAPI